MNRETQIWTNAIAILEDQSVDPELRTIAERIRIMEGITAQQADRIFEWRPTAAPIAAAKSGTSAKKPSNAENL